MSRVKALGSLFSAVALAASAFIAVITVSPLVAEDILRTTTWSGTPAAVAVAGTALGTSLLALMMARRGRRSALVLGFLLAGLGAALSALAAMTAFFLLFILGLFLMGVGYGASRLARYTAAELYPDERRARAIGYVVWAGTVGSVLGPAVLEPAGGLAIVLGLRASVGPLAVSALGLFLAAAILALLFPEPHTDRERGKPFEAAAGARSLRDALRAPEARLAIAAMLTGQVVMVLLMTMTPVHIRNGGLGLTSIGLVISAHTLGMYALSPLTGWLTDRVGRAPVLFAGLGLLLVASLVASRAGADRPLLILALFLLGFGWNLSFVAGSALLTDAVAPSQRTRAQGAADSLVWAASASSSLASGFLLTELGFVRLVQLGALLTLLGIIFAGFYQSRCRG